MMTRRVLTDWRDQWDEVAVVFANTGEENEATLEFVRRCDEEFDFGAVWVEAVFHAGKKGTTHRIVDFNTASRNGEPYLAMVQKYGIPNQNYPHCTRELKHRPMYSYIRSLGWEPSTYDIAIGIRADETNRVSATAAASRIVYPLVDRLPTTKPDVNLYWSEQPFRLELMGYEGNCKWCWKKSLRKLLTIMQDNPEKFDFPADMEPLYTRVGPEFAKGVAAGYQRMFFRGNVSTSDLRALCAAGGVRPSGG